jgi:2-oxoisovalerate dehydrogenase E1 component beta subunit
MSGALNRALYDALAEDARVLVFGEDVGASGGVFRVTDGLQTEYGEARVFDTPISEAGIVGTAVGLCFAGWRPVVELQFDAFSYPAFEQVVDHVAKMRMRTRGRVDMPITIRIPSFGGIKGKEHHGESPETYYAHTAGLKVVVPSSPLDAYTLLRYAISDPDPVVVLEPKARYWPKEEGDLPTDGPGIGHGRVLREGGDVTLVAYGSMVTRPSGWPSATSARASSICARCRRSTTTSCNDAPRRPGASWWSMKRRATSGSARRSRPASWSWRSIRWPRQCNA